MRFVHRRLMSLGQCNAQPYSLPSLQNYIISTIPNQLLPKLYAIAMLWTINSRKAIRMVASNSGKTSSSEGVSVGRTRRTVREPSLLTASKMFIQLTRTRRVTMSNSVVSRSTSKSKPFHTLRYAATGMYPHSHADAHNGAVGASHLG